MLPKYERSANGSTNVSNIWIIGIQFGKGVNLREKSNTLSVNTSQKIGVFRNSHDWYLDYNGNGTWDGNVTDRQYALGKVGDMPVVGDWNGDGKTEIGVFRDNHTWNVDYNGNGVWDGMAGETGSISLANPAIFQYQVTGTEII